MCFTTRVQVQRAAAPETQHHSGAACELVPEVEPVALLTGRGSRPLGSTRERWEALRHAAAVLPPGEAAQRVARGRMATFGRFAAAAQAAARAAASPAVPAVPWLPQRPAQPAAASPAAAAPSAAAPG